MRKLALFIKIILLGLMAASLTGCLITAAAVGTAAGVYYEKNKKADNTSNTTTNTNTSNSTCTSSSNSPCPSSSTTNTNN